MANVFQSAIWKKRTTAEERNAAFGELRPLPIAVDDTERDLVWTDVVMLSGKHHLTAYDAVYLELAIRRRLPFATFDKDLIKAARAEGVGILP